MHGDEWLEMHMKHLENEQRYKTWIEKQPFAYQQELKELYNKIASQTSPNNYMIGITTNGDMYVIAHLCIYPQNIDQRIWEMYNNPELKEISGIGMHKNKDGTSQQYIEYENSYVVFVKKASEGGLLLHAPIALQKWYKRTHMKFRDPGQIYYLNAFEIENHLNKTNKYLLESLYQLIKD